MKLLQVAISLLEDKAKSGLTGLTVKVKLLALFGIFATLAAGFFLVAMTVLLSQEVGAVYACLIMTAIFTVFAVVMLVLHARVQRKRRIERVEAMARASSAEALAGADFRVLAEAFVRGFLGGKR